MTDPEEVPGDVVPADAALLRAIARDSGAWTDANRARLDALADLLDRLTPDVANYAYMELRASVEFDQQQVARASAADYRLLAELDVQLATAARDVMAQLARRDR